MRNKIFTFVAIMFLNVPLRAPAQQPDVGNALLESAKTAIAAPEMAFDYTHLKRDVLRAKLAILESRTNTRQAVERARSIENPFYASLALGGIAATLRPTDMTASTNLFCEALDRAENIREYWNDYHTTSLGCLFALIPYYPRDQAVALLEKAKKTLDAWSQDSSHRSDPILALSKVITSVAPEDVESFLLNVVLKDVDYYSYSIAYLTAFMTKQSPDRALRLAEAHYAARKNRPDERHFLFGVLIELSATDFEKAWQSVLTMRDGDRESAAITLAATMRAANKINETERALKYLEEMNSESPQIKEWIERLRNAETETPNSKPNATPESIDDFLQNPSESQVQTFAYMTDITFRNKQQARAFVATALPIAETVLDNGFRHGMPRSDALGTLAMCSAATGDFDNALEIANRIKSTPLRIRALLDAYEQANPLPDPVQDWPIHYGRKPNISIQD